MARTLARQQRAIWNSMRASLHAATAVGCAITTFVAPVAHAIEAASNAASPTVQDFINGRTVEPAVATTLMRDLLADARSTAASPVSNKKTEDDYVQAPPVKCMADEESYMAIEKAALWPFFDLLGQQPSSATLQRSFARLQLESTIGPRAMADKKVDARIDLFNWKAPKAKALSPTASSRALADWIKSFKANPWIQFSTRLVLSSPQMRDQKDGIRRADLYVRFDVRGAEGVQKRQDRGELIFTVERNAPDKWDITKVRVAKGQTLKAAADAASFSETTGASGLTAVATYRRAEAIRRGGYALAIGDYNGDGAADLFVGSAGHSQLFKGDGKGGFVSDTPKGLEFETLVKSAAFWDFNNDGKQDLFLVRFAPEVTAHDWRAKSSVLIYENKGNGSFAKVANAFEFPRANHAMPAAIGDFNGDGLLDFYVGLPGLKDFTHMGEASSDPATNVETQGLFINAGNGKFINKTVPGLLSKELAASPQQFFPHSAIAADFNQDGKMDILVIDDRANLSPLYRNEGSAVFTETAEAVGVGNHGIGMAAAVGDLDGDGKIDFAMTNVETDAAERISASCMENWRTPALHSYEKPLRIFKGTGGGKFAELDAAQIGLDAPGTGLAGVTFLDYNNDGCTDIYVANGLWSGTDPHQDLSSYYVRGSLNDHLPRNGAITRSRATPDRSNLIDALAAFRGDSATATYRADGPRPSLAGFQRNRLYLNNCDGTYTEVAYLEGVDSIADGYMAATADINGDGKVDLILRNADPGSFDVKYAPLQVYKNVHPSSASLRIKLVGTTSNSMGVGSSVTVKTPERSQLQQALSVSGTVQSESVLHFGLGAAREANVEVKWPSGKVTKIEHAAAGLLVIREDSAKMASTGP